MHERKTFDQIGIGETFFGHWDYYRAEPMVKLDSNTYVDHMGLRFFLVGGTDWHDCYITD